MSGATESMYGAAPQYTAPLPYAPSTSVPSTSILVQPTTYQPLPSATAVLMNPSHPLHTAQVPTVLTRPLYEREVAVLDLKEFRNSSTHPSGAYLLLLMLPGIGWFIYLAIWKSRATNHRKVENTLLAMSKSNDIVKFNRAIELAHPDLRWMYFLERGRSFLAESQAAEAVHDLEVVATSAPCMSYEACYLYAKARDLYALEDLHNAITHYKSALHWYTRAEQFAITEEQKACRQTDRRHVSEKLAAEVVDKYKVLPENTEELRLIILDIQYISSSLSVPSTDLNDLLNWVNLKYIYRCQLEIPNHNYCHQLNSIFDIVRKQIARKTLTSLEKQNLITFIQRNEASLGTMLATEHSWVGPWNGTKDGADIVKQLEV